MRVVRLSDGETFVGKVKRYVVGADIGVTFRGAGKYPFVVMATSDGEEVAIARGARVESQFGEELIGRWVDLGGVKWVHAGDNRRALYFTVKQVPDPNPFIALGDRVRSAIAAYDIVSGDRKHDHGAAKDCLRCRLVKALEGS